MAFLTCHFKSDVLGKACAMNVIIPQKPSKKECPPYPVLYLLHGLSDDSSIWARLTSIERYAWDYDVVIVMPDGERGFYTDAQVGFNYWTMVSQELHEIVANIFPITRKREDTFAAGLSMGGYGALKLALKQPDKFAGAVGISSVADIKDWFTNIRATPEMTNIFGSNEIIDREGNDLFALAESAKNAAVPPKIMTICGTEDSLYQNNQNLRNHLQKIGYPGYEYREGPGIHTWSFWDQWIQVAMKFLLEK